MDQSVVAVTGMSCGHCADAVRAEIVRIPGVSHVDVDVDSGQVRIAADARPDPAAIRAAVEAAGYELAG
jgi:copper chaperone CopZ